MATSRRRKVLAGSSKNQESSSSLSRDDVVTTTVLDSSSNNGRTTENNQKRKGDHLVNGSNNAYTRREATMKQQSDYDATTKLLEVVQRQILKILSGVGWPLLDNEKHHKQKQRRRQRRGGKNHLRHDKWWSPKGVLVQVPLHIWQASGVLVLTIVTCMIWNYATERLVDPQTRKFYRTICGRGGAAGHHGNDLEFVESAFCHPGMKPARGRTLKMIRRIDRSGVTVLKVPRRYQIWDLDALRDATIRRELFSARMRLGQGGGSPGGTRSHDNDNYYSEDDAQDEEGGVPPSPAAFLAAYLSRLQHKFLRAETTATTADHRDEAVNDNADDDNSEDGGVNAVLVEYLKTLPTHEELQEFHPYFWTAEELEQLLGRYSTAARTVTTFQEMIPSEYKAFCRSSATSKYSSLSSARSSALSFCEGVSLRDYVTARLAVMTRSFSTGPIPGQEASSNHEDSFDSLEEEIASYQRYPGINLTAGSHAMVPVLDMYNHHARPNVEFSYRAETESGGAFVIRSTGVIPAGQEIMDSYGRHSDSNLFAKYGFVNGDGSDWSEASLAVWHWLPHNPEHPELAQAMTSSREYRKRLRYAALRYLQYDDGYADCVLPPKNNDKKDASAAAAWNFKVLKYRFLVERVCHQSHLSTVYLRPRNNQHAQPPVAFDVPSSAASGNEQLLTPIGHRRKGTIVVDQNSLNHVTRTCRLLSMVHTDYDGRAPEILLESIMKNESFVVLPSPTPDALEFRTLWCVLRLAAHAIARMGSSERELISLIRRIMQRQQRRQPNEDTNSRNKYSTWFQSKNWTAAVVRLGEVQTLQATKAVATATLQQLFGGGDGDNGDEVVQDLLGSSPAYTMRDKPCPMESALHPLLLAT